MTTITPPKSPTTSTPPSGAAAIAARITTEAKPVLATLVANAEAVMERLSNPPAKGNAAAGIPANLGAVPIEHRARFASGLIGGELVAGRELARRDLHELVSRAEPELTSWLTEERDAAERSATGVARPMAETEEALRLSAVPVGLLMSDARRALRSGDPDLAAVHVQAARLAGGGYVIREVAAEVDAVLDTTRPERIKARERVNVAQREYVTARGRLAKLSRIAATLGKNPELEAGAVQRDPGALVQTWDEALDAARAILATP